MYSKNNGQVFIWCILIITIRVVGETEGDGRTSPCEEPQFFSSGNCPSSFWSLLEDFLSLFHHQLWPEFFYVLDVAFLLVQWPGNPRIHVPLETQPVRTLVVGRDLYSVDEPIRNLLKSSRTGRSD